jgi:hypothetical protein
MNDQESKTYAWLLNETKPELGRHRRRVVIGSILASLAILCFIKCYWLTPTLTDSTRLVIGGQFYALFGALLLAIGAISRPSTLGLMSMTRLNGNPKLFAELMKSRFSARVGIGFVVGGFLMQGLVMIISGS